MPNTAVMLKTMAFKKHNPNKRKAKPFKSIINLYTMYKVNITKKGEKNANNTRGNSYK